MLILELLLHVDFHFVLDSVEYFRLTCCFSMKVCWKDILLSPCCLFTGFLGIRSHFVTREKTCFSSYTALILRFETGIHLALVIKGRSIFNVASLLLLKATLVHFHCVRSLLFNFCLGSSDHFVILRRLMVNEFIVVALESADLLI